MKILNSEGMSSQTKFSLRTKHGFYVFSTVHTYSSNSSNLVKTLLIIQKEQLQSTILNFSYPQDLGFIILHKACIFSVPSTSAEVVQPLQWERAVNLFEWARSWSLVGSPVSEDLLEADKGLGQWVELVHCGVETVQTLARVCKLVAVGDHEEEPAVNLERLPVCGSHCLQEEEEEEQNRKIRARSSSCKSSSLMNWSMEKSLMRRQKETW